MAVRSPLDIVEGAIIGIEGATFLLSLVTGAVPEKGEDYERAMDVLEAILHDHVQSLRKAYDECHKLVVKDPKLRAKLCVVHDADGEPVAS